MRRRQKRERNRSLNTPLIGPLDAARLWGYAAGRSFKGMVPELRRIGEIRAVEKLKGTFYVLEDVIRVRHPDASDEEIQAALREFREGKIHARARGTRRQQWIEAEEAMIILGLPSEAALQASLVNFPKIQKVRRQGRNLYNLRHCFRRVFQEADDNQLDELIISYKREKFEKRSRQDENSQEG